MNKQYPIGKFTVPEFVTQDHLTQWQSEISSLPAHIQLKVAGATKAQLDTPYRAGGWTVRQVINHLADSHLNSFSRFKLALTEENPTIRPYNETLWAETPDGKNAPIDWSLSILEGLHARWTFLLENMTDADQAKTFFHPEYKTYMRLDTARGMYAWHGNHHLAHIGLVL